MSTAQQITSVLLEYVRTFKKALAMYAQDSDKEWNALAHLSAGMAMVIPPRFTLRAAREDTARYLQVERV